MGSVEIRDGSDRDRYASTRWEGRVVLDLDDIDHPRVVLTGQAPFGDVEVERADCPPRDRPGRLDHAWLLVAPAVVAAVAVAAALAGAGGRASGPLRHVTVGVLFAVSLAGTLLLYDDANRVRRSVGEWRPNPWTYLVGGGLVLLLSRLASVAGGRIENAPAFLAGSLVVAVVVSSVAAGPVYLYRRRRRVEAH